MEESQNHLREEDEGQDGVMGGKLEPMGTGGICPLQSCLES